MAPVRSMATALFHSRTAPAPGAEMRGAPVTRKAPSASSAAMARRRAGSRERKEVTAVSGQIVRSGAPPPARLMAR